MKEQPSGDRRVSSIWRRLLQRRETAGSTVVTTQRDTLIESLQAINPADFIDNKVEFPLTELIGRRITSKEQLRRVLLREHYEEMPKRNGTIDYNRFPLIRTPVIVLVSDIVGASSSIENWSVINHSKSRGLDNVFEIVQKLQAGDVDLNWFIGPNDPIILAEREGKYFVGEGRHRVAAMKALQITACPTMLLQYKS